MLTLFGEGCTQEQLVWLGQETMLRTLLRLRTADHGTTAIEYALIIGMIFLASVGAMEAFSINAVSFWTFLAGEIP